MATAYVYFGKPINPDTATGLLHACRLVLNDVDKATGKPAWDTLHISIVSGGGDIAPAVGLYNELRGLPCKIHTHNAGAVDSAALLIFMAGSVRKASRASGFFFHQSAWTFAGQTQQVGAVGEARTWLAYYADMLATIAEQPGKLSKDDVRRLVQDGTSVSPEQALAYGLIHGIEERSTPQGARTWQV